MADHRWDWLEGVRAKAAGDALADEVGKQLASEILACPPRVRFSDEIQQAQFAELFAVGAPSPSKDAIALSFRLARLEIEREFDAVAFEIRNHAFEQVGNSYDALAARFLHRWLSEWLFELNDHLVTKLSRAQMSAALAAAEIRT